MEMTESLVELPHDDTLTDMLTEVSVGPESQDVVQIHAGNDDLEYVSTPHAKTDQ